MSRRRLRPSTPRPSRVGTVAAAVLFALLAGCPSSRNLRSLIDAPPALTQETPKDEVIAHLNRNIESCTGWRAPDAVVRMSGVPFKLGAAVAVESPRNFRMIVSAINGDQADFGSNEERMWFWVRQMEPKAVLTCSHADLPAAQQRLASRGVSIPFRPDWLMEVLGVIPLNPASFEMHADPADAGQAVLVSRQQAPDGTAVVRSLTVDLRRGVVTAHTLRDGNGSLIAEAKLSDHRRDEKSGVLMPRTVAIALPQAGADMTLTLGDVEVNPAGFSANLWQPPQQTDCPTYDLGHGGVVPL